MKLKKQTVLRDNLTGRFISKKRFKKLSKKRTSKETFFRKVFKFITGDK